MLTKDDLKAIREVVAGEVSEVAQDLMVRIDESLNDVKSVLKGVKDDLKGLKSSVARIESKLDPTIHKVDDHEVRIKQLEHKAA